MQQRIERVDDIPILLEWLKRMGIQEKIDSHWQSHGNLSGLSYRQPAELFLTCLTHSFNHRLYQMEPWLADHQTLIEQITGWQCTSKDAADDRLATLVQALGTDDAVRAQFQQDSGRHLVQA
jgi:hypothetical protein